MPNPEIYKPLFENFSGSLSDGDLITHDIETLPDTPETSTTVKTDTLKM